MKAPILLMMLFVLPLLVLSAQPQKPGKIKVAIVKNDSEGPRAMAEGGLLKMLERLGCEIKNIDTVALTDVIYVHVDMDVLDPAEVQGHSLTVPQGPKSEELAAAIRKMFAHPKVAAIGIASLPFGQRDKKRLSLKAAYRLIEGAVRGIKGR